MSTHGIATLSTGKGPPVLLINGWCCPADAWGAVPTALAAIGLRAVAVDLPGWGRSLAPQGMHHRAIEYADALKSPNVWQELRTVTLQSAVEVHIDYDSPRFAQRFYRAVPVK